MAAAARSGAKATTDAKAEDVQTSADTGKGSPKGGAGTVPKNGLGKAAYEAYRSTVDGGDAMDDWDDVHKNDSDNGRQAAAWEAAAQAALGATFGKKEA